MSSIEIECPVDNEEVNRIRVKKEREEPSSIEILPQSAHTLEMDRIISAGSYGVVWNMKNPITGERVALKYISNVFYSLHMSKMIFREVRMMSSLKHDNVISALEIVQPPSLDLFEEVLIVTELMSADLGDLIYSDRPLTEDHIHNFMYQLLRGLKYIHSAKILHRDIKPGNILVSGDVLKICDFGMARAEELDRSKPMSPRVGTRAYHAPEILFAEDHFNYCGAVDVWSVACTFIELLTRNCYFDETHFVHHLNRMIDLVGTPQMEDVWYACDSVKLFLATRAPQPPTFANVTTHANEEALDLLSRMMTFDPEKRITAADALDHPYMCRGRQLYHNGLCSCCGFLENGDRYLTWEFEPVASHFFDDAWEKDIVDVEQARQEMFKFIRGQMVQGTTHLSMG